MLKALITLAVLALLPALADAQVTLLRNTATRTITVAPGSPFGIPATVTLNVDTLGFYQGSAFGNTSARSVQWCLAFDGIGQGWIGVMENAPAVYTTFAAVKSPDPVKGIPDLVTDPGYFCANGK